jgi:hypothetical protein
MKDVKETLGIKKQEISIQGWAPLHPQSAERTSERQLVVYLVANYLSLAMKRRPDDVFAAPPSFGACRKMATEGQILVEDDFEQRKAPLALEDEFMDESGVLAETSDEVPLPSNESLEKMMERYTRK